METSNTQTVEIPLTIKLEVVDGKAKVPQHVYDTIMDATAQKTGTTYTVSPLEKHYAITLQVENSTAQQTNKKK